MFHFLLPGILRRRAGQPGSPDLGEAALNRDQLGLPLGHTPQFTGADFLEAPSNADALAWLARQEEWPDQRLAIWGEPGCGKTHLLHLWAARSSAVLQRGPFLRVSEPPVALAIDDADDTPDEAALLHALNLAASAGAFVLLASTRAPARWPVKLPDLVSRLRSTMAVEIGPAEDFLLRSLLMRLLAERQITVPAAVQDWLLVRLPRTAGAVRDAVARLDRAQLADGRAVTRQLAASVLAELSEAED